MNLNTDLIRYELAKRGMTQTELAEVTGVSPSTVGRLLKTSNANRMTVKVIAEALELELGQMYVAPKEA